MADDEFAQIIKGQFKEGDSFTSDDYLIPIGAKDTAGKSIAIPVGGAGGVLVQGSTGGLLVQGTVSVTGTVDSRYLGYTTDSVTVYGTVAVSNLTSITGTVGIIGTVAVEGVDFDIRNLTGTTDHVRITDGVDALVINTDGSINVVTSDTAASYITFGTANLVKDTPTLVKTYEAGPGGKNVRGLLVSGAGKCIWNVYVGATGNNTDTLKSQFLTNVTMNTQEVDLKNIVLASADNITVYGENKEAKASPASDFVGYVTIITE